MEPHPAEATINRRRIQPHLVITPATRAGGSIRNRDSGTASARGNRLRPVTTSGSSAETTAVTSCCYPAKTVKIEKKQVAVPAGLWKAVLVHTHERSNRRHAGHRLACVPVSDQTRDPCGLPPQPASAAAPVADARPTQCLRAGPASGSSHAPGNAAADIHPAAMART